LGFELGIVELLVKISGLRLDFGNYWNAGFCKIAVAVIRAWAFVVLGVEGVVGLGIVLGFRIGMDRMVG
jgi:hypothetical protein